MASGPSSARAVKGIARYTSAAVFLVVLLLDGAAYCHAGEGADGPKAGQPPIIVTARSLMADNKKKVVVYQKDVVVKRGDITMYANEVTIRLKNSGKSGSTSKELLTGTGKIDTIEAKGGVRIVQQDKTATADEAVYYSDEDKIVLTGKPRVWQGEDVLSGSKITYDIKEDTFLVEDANTILYQGAKAQ